MAAGYSLKINGTRILTSEALYQACRFPHRPEIQRLIVQQASPMTAKMKAKPYRNDSRPDWDAIRIKIMRWCLRVKLSRNWSEFGRILRATQDRAIVEDSRKDDFLGAKAVDDNTLVGANVLGRLLMELREDLKGPNSESLRSALPLDIPNFFLFGRPIGIVMVDDPSEYTDDLLSDPNKKRAATRELVKRKSAWEERRTRYEEARSQSDP